jgi:periplasmic protein TonB
MKKLIVLGFFVFVSLAFSTVTYGQKYSISDPVYPELARAKGITGKVVVDVTIDNQGNVIKAKVISGKQIFRQSALDAAMRSTLPLQTLQNQKAGIKSRIVYDFPTKR